MAPPKLKKKTHLQKAADDASDAIKECNDAIEEYSDAVGSTGTAAVDKDKRIKAVLAGVNKGMKGRAFVRIASEVEQVHHVRRPFGIPDLDLSIAGGCPAGAIIQLFGAAGAGKNFLADCLIRNIQANYGPDAAVVFVSFGYGYDKDRGHQNGVAVQMSDLEVARLQKSRSLTPEDATRRKKRVGNFVEICRGGTKEAEEQPAEHMLESALQLIRSGEFQLIIVDEANAAPTGALMAKSMDENPRQAHNATLLTQFVTKFFSAVATPLAGGRLNETTVVVILEARAKIGGFSPDPNALEQTGGHALKHAKAIDIEVKMGAPIIIDKKKVGKEVPWRVLKAKLGSHEGFSGTFPLLFATEPDSGGALVGGPLLSIAVELGAVQHVGNSFLLEGERFAVGKEAATDVLNTDQDLYDRVYLACLAAKRLIPQYRPDEPVAS